MASQIATLVALLVFLLILNDSGVYGRRTLSIEEDLELETQLKHLNKPAVKSIKTEYGEIYDCVDFYKQPAFDNPLLKNHKPEMSSSIPRETPKEASSSSSSSSGVEGHLDLRLEGGGCPSGTVPIRRTTKEDLIRWKSCSTSSGNIHPFLYEGPGKHYAGYQLRNENLKYRGVSAYVSLRNPQVFANQYSGALLWVEGGQNHVQVGWHVNPNLYGDSASHLFGHWTADGSQNTGCFNTICNGFVQVNKDVYLGQPTRLGTEEISVPMFLVQTKTSANWWLGVGEGDNYEDIGYWPRELFNSIPDFAPVVGWRGEVYAPQGETSPPMGTGNFPATSGIPDFKITAFFKAARVYDENYSGNSPNDDSLESVSNSKRCYTEVDFPDLDDTWKHTIFYGGPGGNC